jgi:hypothetical protein
MLRECAGGHGPAVLTNSIHIGIGTEVKALPEAALRALHTALGTF